ncbi:MAG: type IX secretion system membrane protein PorP/SprF, partial [Bacteroidia bacterium]|nr:type IX secretion system membrane protein PorP/SprF [Bacteroidia bacterium]
KNEVMETTLQARKQWTGFDGSPSTATFTIHSPLKNKSMALGLSVIADKIGSTSNQFISGIYAYRFRVKNTFCSFGLQAGIDFSRTDWESLKRNDVSDNLIVGQQKNKTGLTTGFGYYMHNDLFALGVSIPYLVNTTSAKSIGSSPILFNGSYNVLLKDSSQLRPNFLVRYEMGTPTQVDLGLMYYSKIKIGGGLSYRYNESVIAILEFAAHKDLKFAYSYDFGVNKLRKYHNGSHELMVRFYVRMKKKDAPVEEGK